jgi:hypothetical protein
VVVLKMVQNISGDHYNAVQVELPRFIRFGGNVVRETFANVLSIAVMSFFEGYTIRRI